MPSKSDETHSFTANVYFDRKFAGHASNQGSGGETNFYPNTIGQGFCDYAGKDYVIELIDNQVHEKITKLDKAKKIRKIKKLMLRAVLFINYAADSPQDYQSVQIKGNPVLTDSHLQIIDGLKKQYGYIDILNGKSDDELLQLLAFSFNHTTA